eukprot:gene15638-21143_t
MSNSAVGLIVKTYFAFYCLIPITIHAKIDLCDKLLSYSNPFIGTTGLGYGGGQGSPAAQLPFGALRLGPDSQSTDGDVGYRHCSGYNYLDDTIRAFSHTRLVNAGVDDLGNIGIMPINTDSVSFREKLKSNMKPNLWSSAFEKTSEYASPGQYGLLLSEPQIKVDLLATSKFTGIHKYTWPSAVNTHDKSVIIDVCHGATRDISHNSHSCSNATLTVMNHGKSFAASLFFKGSLSGNGIFIYLYGEFSKFLGDVEDWFVCTNKNECQLSRDGDSVNSLTGQLVGHVKFHDIKNNDIVENTIELHVALSFVSIENAQENFKQNELAHVDFDTARSLTRQAWCDELKAFVINEEEDIKSDYIIDKKSIKSDVDENEELKKIIYSAHYRTLLSPTQYTESNGLYMGMDHVVSNWHDKYPVTDYGRLSNEYFSDLSLWDTFRTQNPWLLLAHVDVGVALLRSMSEMARVAQRVPHWVLANLESGCMIGDHGMATICDAIYAGYADAFDISIIQKVFQIQATDPSNTNRRDLERYLSEGYVSSESADNAASLTLSYAFDDL